MRPNIRLSIAQIKENKNLVQIVLFPGFSYQSHMGVCRRIEGSWENAESPLGLEIPCGARRISRMDGGRMALKSITIRWRRLIALSLEVTGMAGQTLSKK